MIEEPEHDAPLDEAIDFFADCTSFDAGVPDQFVALVLGGSPELDRDVERALLARPWQT
ncbi:MAG: hypothetical protein KDE27_10260 [Planctomycetes bacterium]|nr:hypothetical protein [Planctomycetota bacterium]